MGEIGTSFDYISAMDLITLPSFFSCVDTTTCLVFLTTFLSGILWKSSRRDGRVPPGPPVWPLVGNLPQVIAGMMKHRAQYKVFQEISDKYGPVFSVRMGGEDIVVVTGYEETKEVLLTNASDFVDRPVDEFFFEFTHGNGILFCNGKKWEEIRKFTVVALRDFGVGKRSLESIIQTEAEIVCDKMAASKEPFHPKQLLTLAVANVIFSIIFGDRFEYDDKGFLDVLEKMDYMAKTVGPTMIDNFLPFLAYLPIDTPRKKVIRNRGILEKYTYDRIEEHKQTYDPNATRDYIDLYLKICAEGHKYETLTEPHIFQTILDLYFAGAETTSTSMDWFLLFMVAFPEIQEKCQKEIDEVVGDGRKVVMEDKKSMPYMTAVLHELQRIANVAPLAIPHCTAKDTMLNGYLIPVKTIVLLQLTSIHIDPKFFPEPLKFKPDRWLDENNQIIKDEHLIPFGIGPRKCVGEPLANMELFIFATNFLQRYNFKLADGHSEPSLEGIHTGIMMRTKPYYINVVPR